MLVLTRKRGEQILIGDDIVITILESKGDSVRVGIEAPRGVVIHRLEVMQAVTDANLEASRAAASDGQALAGLLSGMPHRGSTEVPPAE
ncbi:MAG: carbon storage regulator CsrA [Salinibacterium sp.]|nr:carbon storage regulator CsrA [Salinibacterium sp.]